jgi:hypothetical protein
MAELENDLGVTTGFPEVSASSYLFAEKQFSRLKRGGSPRLGGRRNGGISANIPGLFQNIAPALGMYRVFQGDIRLIT